MHKDPLVSVVIPCYNAGTYVQRAIRSIVDQTYRNLEIWIIDDASTDDTLQRIRSFEDERIIIVPFKENTQKIGAVNEVLKQVRGELICFQDADDWSELTRIQKQTEMFLRDEELGICLTGFIYEGEKKGMPDKIVLSDSELKEGFLNFGNSSSPLALPVCAGMMITKAALEKTAGYHPYFLGRVAEDIHWIYRILKHFKGRVVNETLYHYHVQSGSLTAMQYSGLNAKAAYSWPLLARIIHFDVHQNMDILSPENISVLQKTELEACEEALMSAIQKLNKTTEAYKNSRSFKLGQFLLKPLKIFASQKSGQNSPENTQL